MICPKCGHKNDAEDEQCPRCGIFYIKWMISKYRIKKTAGKGLRFAATRWRRMRIWPFALGAGFAGGLTAAWLLLARAPVDTVPYASVKVSATTLREGTERLLKDAQKRAETRGVRLTTADFADYFIQGANSLTLANLKTAAETASPARPTQPGSRQEHDVRDLSPCKCLAAGRWHYYASPPGDEAGAQECWAMVRTLKRETIWDNVFWDIVWEKLVWAPGKKRWAHFTTKEDQDLFRRFIAVELGESAEREDSEESLKDLRTASGNNALLKRAVIRAYRTRLRRAGALHRLELLED